MKIIKNGTIILIIGVVGLLAVIGYEAYSFYAYEQPPEGYTQQEITAMGIEPININTASADEFSAVPHLTEKQIQSILDYRAEHSEFTSVKELLDVKGIGKVTYNRIYVYLTI